MKKSTLPSLLLLSACQGENVVGKTQNMLPDIVIISHGDDFQVYEGDSQFFHATVSDGNNTYDELDVTWYLNDTEVCPRTPVNTLGESFCEIGFEVGFAKVVAEVRDTNGGGGRAEVSTTVLGSEPPVVEILSPLENDQLYSDQLILFSAFIEDAEDPAEDLLITWTSSIDGALDIDTTVDSNNELSDFSMLSSGEHGLELRVEDSSGKVSTDEVIVTVGGENTLPDCELLSPEDDGLFAVDELIEFVGAASDANVPADSLSVEWSSDKDGVFGQSVPTSQGDIQFSYADLSTDAHTITMRVTDDVGGTCTAQVNLTVTTGPEVLITSPQDGEIFDVGENILFEGTVSDNEDNASSILMEWYSSITGELYTGYPFSNGLVTFSRSDLIPGLHIISFGGRDSNGINSEDVISITINNPPIIDSFSLTPLQPELSDLLICEASVSDTDGSITSVTYDFLNLNTGSSYPPTTSNNSIASLNLSTTNAVEGDSIQCTVEATDNLGSVTEASLIAVISSETPVFSAAASITPGQAYTNTPLTCSATASQLNVGPIIPTYEWDINGNVLGSSAGFTPTAANSNVGDTITCTATATGSTGVVTTSATSVSLLNTAPTLSLSLTPNPIYENGTLTCTASASDIDNDSLSYGFTFSNNSNGSSYGTGNQNGSSSSLDLAANGVTAGDIIECHVAVSDGNGGVTSVNESIAIQNDPTPIFTNGAVINPSSPTTGSNLTCSATAEEAGIGSLTPSYAWQINGVTAGSQQSLTVTSSNSNVGDTITCTATATGSTGIVTTSTATATVQNTSPSLSTVSIAPSILYSDSTMTCSTTATDIDADSLQYSFTIQNLTTGSLIASGTSSSNSFILDVLALGGQSGHIMECVATVTDGNGGSNTASAQASIDTDPTPYFILGASITPPSGVTLDTALSCSATAGLGTVTYEWLNGGSVIGTGQSITVNSNNSSVGDTIVCKATATGSTGLTAESTDTVTINNRAPNATAQLSTSGTITTGTTLTCTGSVSDPDDGSLSPSYTWIVDNVNTGVNSNTFTTTASNTNVGSTIYCSVSGTDNNGASANASSNTVSIINTQATLGNVDIPWLTFGGTECNHCSTNEIYYCDYNLNDPDQNALVQVEWFIDFNGGGILSGVIGTGDTINPVSSGINPGDRLRCVVSVYDPSFVGSGWDDVLIGQW